MTRLLHQELLNHIPDCDPCARDQHDYCTPIVEPTATVCACFTAHPNSEAHDNAIYWWSQQGQADRPATNWVCPNCQTGWEEPMQRCTECGWTDDTDSEPSVFEGNVTIGGFTVFTSTACTSTTPHPEHPINDGTTCLGIPPKDN